MLVSGRVPIYTTLKRVKTSQHPQKLTLPVLHSPWTQDHHRYRITSADHKKREYLYNYSNLLSRRISRVSVDICSLCWSKLQGALWSTHAHHTHVCIIFSIHGPAVACLASRYPSLDIVRCIDMCMRIFEYLIFIYTPKATDVILPTIAMPLTHQSHGQHLVTKKTIAIMWTQQAFSQIPNCQLQNLRYILWWLPSRELTYPTLGKGKSS